MARTSIAFWIRPEDYEAFKTLCRGGPYWPDTFDAWLNLASKDVAKDEARGWTVQKQIVYPDEFARWCIAGGAKPHHEMLTAFAVEKAWRER